MRYVSLVRAVLVTTLCSVHALASVYNFQATETSALSPSTTTFDFSLDTSGATFAAGTTTFNGVAISENGTTFPNNIVGTSFNTNLSSPLFFFVDTDPTMLSFSSGTGSGIVFNTGTFAIADGATDGEGTLTISASPTASPVPEPSTWSLMIVGIGMAGALVRSSRAYPHIDYPVLGGIV